jgi:hypothetical protein
MHCWKQQRRPQAASGASGAARWCSGVAGRPNQRGPSGAEAQALMAELVALRAILLNVLFKLANGERPTADEMQSLIDRADSDKLSKARARLAQAAQSEVHPQEKS